MKNIYKLFAFILLIFLIFSLSPISAQDLNQTSSKEINLESNDLENPAQSNGREEDYNLQSNENNDLNLPFFTGSTFQDLQTIISNANSGDTIYLEGKTYSGTGLPILINKELTIIGTNSSNGRNANLNANQQSCIFTIMSNNVTIKGINFIDGMGEMGGAINWIGDNGKLTDSTFSDNAAKNKGGAIYWSGNNATITNSKFVNNAAKIGGAVYFEKNVKITNTVFDSNIAYNDGGAIYNKGSDSKIYKCKLNNNIVSTNPYLYSGAAIFNYGRNLTVTESTFTKNKAKIGSVITSYSDSHFYNCSFIGNEANTYSLIVHCTLDSEYEDRNAIVNILSLDVDNSLLKGFYTSETGKITFNNVTCIENGNTTTISSIINPIPVKGNVSICLNGNEIFKQNNVENGTVIIPLKDIASKSYNATVIVKNENGIESIDKYITIPRIEYDSEFISPKIVIEGETADYIVILPSDATGFITLTLNKKIYHNIFAHPNAKSYRHEIIPGENTIISVSDLPVEEYDIWICYSGDEKYNSKNIFDSLTIKHADISANSSDIIIKLPANANGNITVLIDNQTVYNNTITNNTIAIPITNITRENHNITVIVDSNGEKIVESEIVNVPKADPNMIVEIPEYVNEGENFAVRIILPKDATGNISFSINNKPLIPLKIEHPEFKIFFKLTNGKHTINITYSGDEKYKSSSVEKVTTITKLGIGTEIMAESEFTRVATDFNAGERGDYFYAILKDIDGNPLANKTVQIAVNGPIYTITTDSEGRAGLKINLASANTYTYALFFQGDEIYNASLLASSKLSVTKKPMYISASNYVFKASAATKTVTVTLTTIENQYDGKMYLNKGKKVTLTINGKTYSSTSDANGIVKFNIGSLIKKGTYNAVIKFAGDQTYDSAKKTVTIKLDDKGATTTAKAQKGTELLKTKNSGTKASAIPTSNLASNKKNTIIEVDETFTRAACDYSAGERGKYFYAILKDSAGNPLTNKTIQIAVNGPIYNVTTDSEGHAGIQINLASANTYTYALSFSGDSEYNAASLVCSKLVVIKKTMKITSKDQCFKSTDKTKTVTATLKTTPNKYDGKTYLSSGKKVSLKVDGKTYTGTIDKNGKVSFNVQITKKGTFNAVISFDGDKTYNSATKTIKIKIN